MSIQGVGSSDGIGNNGGPPVKKLLIASILAAFGTAVMLPLVSSDDAFAAGKKKTKTEKPMKKKPTGKM